MPACFALLHNALETQGSSVLRELIKAVSLYGRPLQTAVSANWYCLAIDYRCHQHHNYYILLFAVHMYALTIGAINTIYSVVCCTYVCALAVPTEKGCAQSCDVFEFSSEGDKSCS